MQCSASAASSMQQQAQYVKRASERARTDAIEPEFAGEQPWNRNSEIAKTGWLITTSQIWDRMTSDCRSAYPAHNHNGCGEAQYEGMCLMYVASFHVSFSFTCRMTPSA